MGWLKRLFGSTDAMKDARERAEKAAVTAAADAPQAGRQPPGWTTPEVTQTDDEVVLRMDAPGLDPETVHTDVDGSALILQARGSTDSGAQLSLNERLVLKGADLSQADVSYEDGKLVVRLPKSTFKPESTS